MIEWWRLSTAHFLICILKLTSLFQMKSIVKECEKHLLEAGRIDVMKKLQFADQYKFATRK
ncbi:hypothetical protein PMAYCL1PPCAC_25474, partial [Pristionchus mayeri]